MTQAQKYVARRYPEADAYPEDVQDVNGNDYVLWVILDDADVNPGAARILGQGITAEAAWKCAARCLGSKR